MANAKDKIKEYLKKGTVQMDFELKDGTKVVTDVNTEYEFHFDFIKFTNTIGCTETVLVEMKNIVSIAA